MIKSPQLNIEEVSYYCIDIPPFSVAVTVKLTHICLVDYTILINWTSQFTILGVSGVVLFHFYSISNRYSC